MGAAPLSEPPPQASSQISTRAIVVGLVAFGTDMGLPRCSGKGYSVRRMGVHKPAIRDPEKPKRMSLSKGASAHFRYYITISVVCLSTLYALHFSCYSDVLFRLPQPHIATA